MASRLSQAVAWCPLAGARPMPMGNCPVSLDRLHLPLCVKGGEMKIQGLFQHHPDGRLLFLHRAGVKQRKYDCALDLEHPISHLMLHPSCAWNRVHKPFRPTMHVRQRDIITTRQVRQGRQAIFQACHLNNTCPMGRTAAASLPDEFVTSLVTTFAHSAPHFSLQLNGSTIPSACSARMT